MDLENLGEVEQVVEVQAEEVAPENAVEELENQEVEGQEKEPTKTEDETPFPKKAVNAISRRDKQIGKLRAEREALRREIDALKQSMGSQQKSERKEPSEAEFDSYTDYLKAHARFAAEDAIHTADKSQKENRLKSLEEAESNAYIEERSEVVGDQLKEFVTKYPDAVEMLQQYTPIIASFPPQLEQVILELDNAPQAMYNLAKAGKLERLAQMPIQLAVVELVQAQSKAPVSANKVSQAPKPINAAKGSGVSSKTADSMSYDELLKAL